METDLMHLMIYRSYNFRRRPERQLALIRLDAARMLMRATDSLLRRGKRLNPERWLVKEFSEVTPGVVGPP